MAPRPKTKPALSEWVVLALLLDEPRHGWALARELAPEGSIGQVWTLSHQLVYHALDALVAAGLAAPRRTVDSDEGPRRTIHGVTVKGRKAMKDWLDAPVEHLRDVRTELLGKLVLRDRLGLDQRSFLVTQRRAFAPLVRALASWESGAPSGANRIVARWRAETAEAVVQFIDGMLADLTENEAPR